MRRFFIGWIAVMLLVWLIPVQALAGPPKSEVDICHWSEDEAAFHQISIAARAEQRHRTNHGDGMIGEPVPGVAGYEFDEACEAIQSEILFAVAYTDIDPSDGGYNPNVDVLIAKFIDGNGNGIPDVGDKLVAKQYPTSQTAPYEFASFQNTGFTVTQVSFNPPPDPGNYQIVHSTGWMSFWPNTTIGAQQFDDADGANTTRLLDGISVGGFPDRVLANTASPAMPTVAVPLGSDVFRLGDDPFLDVEILIAP